MAHNDRRKPCHDCDREVAHTLDGRPYAHKCAKTDPAGFTDPAVYTQFPAPVSDPAPTVESMDDTTGTQCSEPRCTCGGDGGPEHELAIIAYGDAPVDDKGPWFGAMYDGRCSVSECQIYEGERIRADGQGGYECEDCGDDDASFPRVDPSPVPGPVGSPDGGRRDAVPASVMTADEFLDPAEPEVKLNVSGQPEARRDWQKRYIVVDPDLGDFRRTVKEKKPKGITRATTFNKHAQNTTSLNAWGKRNVVMGASLRPDILRRAHGLTHETGKQELDQIVDELETAAGAKVAADEGTFLHEFCEQVDAGLKTWRDAPPAYQQDIKRYVEALEAEGLEPVPGLIERTTFIREYGGVAGTFDNVYYHRPSGQYIVGDKKTGKTMSYAMDETECQIWTYAHGVNQTGVYDWNTDTWCPALDGTEERHYADQVPEQRYIRVSEKVGVIVHMPVQGPEAGEVYLRFADLECGRAYAELNHAVRSYPKSKVRPFVMPSAAPERESWQDIGGGVEVRHSVVDVPAPERPWEAEFRGVRTGEDANALWRQAKAAGIKGERLAALVDLARQSIRNDSWSQRQGLPSSPR